MGLFVSWLVALALASAATLSLPASRGGQLIASAMPSGRWIHAMRGSIRAMTNQRRQRLLRLRLPLCLFGVQRFALACAGRQILAGRLCKVDVGAVRCRITQLALYREHTLAVGRATTMST